MGPAVVVFVVTGAGVVVVELVVTGGSAVVVDPVVVGDPLVVVVTGVDDDPLLVVTGGEVVVGAIVVVPPLWSVSLFLVAKTIAVMTRARTTRDVTMISDF